MSTLKIIGIDPGYGRIGVGCIEVEGNRYSYLFHDVIETNQNDLFPARLAMINKKIEEICGTFKPDEAAIEKLFFVKNVTTAMKVSEARGVIQLALHRCNVAIFEYTPFEIKQSVTGNGHAEKSQVQKTLSLLLKLEVVPKQDDAADALAAAFCHANSRKLLKGIGHFKLSR
jgi:crossover junction endodeoxyribonuclease RuvC